MAVYENKTNHPLVYLREGEKTEKDEATFLEMNCLYFENHPDPAKTIETFRQKWSGKDCWPRKHYKKTETIFAVSKDSDEIVGYIDFTSCDKDCKSECDGKGYMCNGLYIFKSYRRYGVGTFLLNEMFRRVSKISNAEYCCICLEGYNTRAKNIYLKLGYMYSNLQVRDNLETEADPLAVHYLRKPIGK